MKKYIIISFLTVLILFIPSMVYASYESESNLEEESCIFTAYIEKTWVMFQESPWVTGFVYNCDSREYHEKDRVLVRILDINGDLVEDSWQQKKTTAHKDTKPSLYTFTEHVYRKGSFTGNANVEKEVVHITPNQYFFYLPQINSLDFEHRAIHQIELTYGDHVRTIWFATLNPNIWWEDDEKKEADPCIDYREKLVRKNITLDALNKELVRLELNGQVEKYENQLTVIEDMEKQIDELETC